MKRFGLKIMAVGLIGVMAFSVVSCSEKNSEEEDIIESIETEVSSTEVTAIETVEETSVTADENIIDSYISDEMALDAIINRCCLDNPAFADLGADHWVVISSTDSQVVVLFTSYTGAELRYYIDRTTGDTSVTELVPGIIDEEQATDESFNARDYITAEIYG